MKEEEQEAVLELEKEETPVFKLPLRGTPGTLVEVRPIPETKWHGKEGKENFASPKTIQALYDQRTGGYATGLTELERKGLEDELGVDLSKRYNATQPSGPACMVAVAECAKPARIHREFSALTW